MMLLALLGCGATPEPPSEPEVDLASAKLTCFEGVDGTTLGVELAIRPEIVGYLDRPGQPRQLLRGKREGRELVFPTVTVQLFGRSVGLTEGEAKSLLEAAPCRLTPR